MIYETESKLNKNLDYKKEMEGSISDYIRIFINTFRNSGSFNEYEKNLIEQNIIIPDYIKNTIQRYLSDTGKLEGYLTLF